MAARIMVGYTEQSQRRTKSPPLPHVAEAPSHVRSERKPASAQFELTATAMVRLLGRVALPYSTNQPSP